MLGACSKEPAMEQPASESEVVRLDFTAGIVADAVPSTRATIDGSVFPPRNDAYLFGMWVCKHEDDPSAFIPAMNDYENMRVALYAVTTDEGGTNSSGNILSTTSRITSCMSSSILLSIFTPTIRVRKLRAINRRSSRRPCRFRAVPRIGCGLNPYNSQVSSCPVPASTFRWHSVMR